jgi:hypothetical protein
MYYLRWIIAALAVFGSFAFTLQISYILTAPTTFNPSWMAASVSDISASSLF